MTTRASIPVEIDWALSAAHRLPQTLHPALRDLYSDDALRQEVIELWEPDEQMGYPGYLELSAVAQPAGLLFTTDSGEFLDRLDEMCAAAPQSYQFLAETPADRQVLIGRLDLLRSDPARRRRYVEVVTAVWSALRPRWEAEGIPAVQAELQRRRAQIDKTPDWRRYAEQWAPLNVTPDLAEAVDAGAEVVIVPAWFTRNKLWIDLPGVLLIGVGTADAEARVRAETDNLARRLKGLSDPTRLSILFHLARKPMTVGELADHMSLAQPTVSNHVKLLREAGLVTPRGEGRGQPLAVDRNQLAAVLVEVAEQTRTPLPEIKPGC